MPGGNKSRKKQLAVAALLSSGTIEQAAQKVGVSERTLNEWLADPGFARLYRTACQRVVEHAITVLQQTCSKAVLTLYQSLEADNPNVRVRAATVLIEQSLNALEKRSILQRLDELESRGRGA
jgi:hypothetical protein